MAWPRRCVLAASAAVVVATTILCSAGPADAAGSPSLDRYIVTDPVSGWLPLSSDALNSTVDSIQRTEQAAIGSAGVTIDTAAEGWHDPAVTTNSVLVILVRVSGNGALVDDELRRRGRRRGGVVLRGGDELPAEIGRPAGGDPRIRAW